MKITFKSKLSILVTSLVFYYFYTSICVGYYLGRTFFEFFDELTKNDPSKSIQLRQKFSAKNIKKIIIDF